MTGNGHGMIWSELPLFIYFVVFAISLVVTMFLVVTSQHHLRFTSRTGDQAAVQAAHSAPTPRVGGIGIALAVCVAFIYAASAGKGMFFGFFALSMVPVFAIGLLEDLSVHMRPGYRLAAAAVSSAVAILLLGSYLPRLDLPLMDTALSFAPFAIIFTIFATTGVCHSINLIDGLNGLSGTISVIIAFSLAVIAMLAGDFTMSGAALCIVPALLGFLIFNFPGGKIFLGDAGAYAIGHVLAWLAVLIVWRNPDVTPWAVLLVFFWPVADTVFAMVRRRANGKPADQPDRLHFHQLVMRLIEISFVGRKRRRLANPMATVVLAPLAAVPAAFGVLLWSNPVLAGLTNLAFSVLFVAVYGLLVRRARSRSGPRRNKLRLLFEAAS